jgi:hypothetical protein
VLREKWPVIGRPERGAVDDGQAALDRLLERLANVPTPAGPTPAARRRL